MSSELNLDQRDLEAALDAINPRLRVNLVNIIEDPAVIRRGGFGIITVGQLTEEGISLYGNITTGKVAIKRLFSDPGKDLRVAFRLIREVKIWESLDHPNILKLLGFYLSSSLDEALIICPWEPCGSINKYIADAKPDMLERLRLLSDVAEGLGYLHGFQPAMCHGDIKGDNVLVSHSRRALLCDFGLAKLVDGHTGLSTSSKIYGSLRWCSPELFYDSPRTSESDIWAYGCFVIEVIYECKPYPYIQNDMAVMVQIIHHMLPAQPENVPQQSVVNLWELLERCWQIEPSKRASAKKCTNSLRIARKISDVIDSPLFERERSGGAIAPTPVRMASVPYSARHYASAMRASSTSDMVAGKWAITCPYLEYGGHNVFMLNIVGVSDNNQIEADFDFGILDGVIRSRQPLEDRGEDGAYTTFRWVGHNGWVLPPRSAQDGYIKFFRHHRTGQPCLKGGMNFVPDIGNVGFHGRRIGPPRGNEKTWDDYIEGS
ncbi:hypothetical protein FRB95_008158 [Tulasnella sp. JGI-2019a]|nr:hypothetical protein FRB95_008158 [Tulasnella sp. JGI-2019a]